MKTPNRRDGSLRACIVALALTGLGGTASAQNLYRTLKGTPAESFTEEDSRLFREASLKALNETSVGETVSWRNPKTQSHGELKVVKDFTWKQNACRQIQVSSEAKGRRATNAVDLCKVSDKWRLVSPTELSKG